MTGMSDCFRAVRKKGVRESERVVGVDQIQAQLTRTVEK